MWILRASLLTALCDITAVDQSEEVWWIYESFWSKPSVKVEIKTTWEVVSTCEVLWSARLNTSKVTESTRRTFRSVRSYEVRRASSARVVVALRDPSQRRWTAAVQHLICITSGVWDWAADIVTVIDIATPCWLLKSSEDRNLRSCERSTTCFRSLAKPGLCDSFRSRARQLVVLLFNWLIDCIFKYNTENIEKI